MRKIGVPSHDQRIIPAPRNKSSQTKEKAMLTEAKSMRTAINPHVLASANLMSLTVSIERITPEVALNYLEMNRSNRRVSEGRVRAYAAAMGRDAWWLNGETIIFAGDGTLMNGQHRLKAVVSSGVPIIVLVVRGVERAAFATQDQVKPRSTGDIVGILGEKSQNAFAGALRVVSLMASVRRAEGYLAPDLVVGEIEKYGGVRDWLPSAEYTKAIAPLSLMAGLLYLFEQASCDTASVRKFAKQLGSGADLQTDSPIFALRKRLLDLKLRKAKVDRNEMAAMIITAWNAYVTGRSLRLIKSDYAKFGMPEIAG